MRNSGTFILYDKLTNKRLLLIGASGNARQRRRMVRLWKKKFDLLSWEQWNREEFSS